MIPLDYSKDLRRLLADGKTLDEALAALRANGVSKLHCVIAVKNFRRCDIGEAKQLVHFSSAWANVRERDESFHAELEEGLQRYDDKDA
jgi:hypothetical protein